MSQTSFLGAHVLGRIITPPRCTLKKEADNVFGSRACPFQRAPGSAQIFGDWMDLSPPLGGALDSVSL